MPETSEALDASSLAAETTEDLESTWKEASRSWGHSLHRLAPYIGGFPPSLAHYFIRRFSEPGDTVLDPFCGGGTTPLEAGLMGRQGYGNDAFSYAYVLSRAKCNPLSTTEFKSYLDQKISDSEDVDNSNMRLLDDEDLEIFYSNYTLDKILRLRKVMSQEPSSVESDYLKAIMCGILHGPSKMYLSLQTKDTYSGTANYVKEYAERNDLERPKRDIRPSALRKHELAQEDSVPDWLSSQTHITNSDARDLPFEECADLILTSPPYMQTLDYTWNNWIRLWWLNQDRKNEQSKLDITQDTTKYRRFMRKCLSKMYGALKEDSVAVLIVGDVTKHLTNRKETLNIAGYLADEAREHTDFEVHGIINDSYGVENRSYVVFNRLKYDHDKDDETPENIDRCLILKKGSPDLSYEPDIDWDEENYGDLS